MPPLPHTSSWRGTWLSTEATLILSFCSERCLGIFGGGISPLPSKDNKERHELTSVSRVGFKTLSVICSITHSALIKLKANILKFHKSYLSDTSNCSKTRKRREHYFIFPLIARHDFVSNSMEQSPSCETDSHSAGQEITCLLWKPKFHYRIHNSPLEDPILSQLNLVNIITTRFCKIHFSVIHTYTPSSSNFSSLLCF